MHQIMVHRALEPFELALVPGHENLGILNIGARQVFQPTFLIRLLNRIKLPVGLRCLIPKVCKLSDEVVILDFVCEDFDIVKSGV